MLVYCKGGSCGRVYYFDVGGRPWRHGEDFTRKRVPADIGGRWNDACFRLCLTLDERAYSADREQAAEAAENERHGQHGCCCTGGGQADKKGGSVMEEKELKIILEKHRAWLADSEDGERANLEGANLEGADLRGANLREANLEGANLSWANLIKADLKEADLRGANLSWANLIKADLKEADLRGANLRGANLRGANLREANLRGADLSDAILREANLRGADLSDAILRWADLREANLRGANLRGANLRGANLIKADLKEADIDYSCLPLWCGSLTAHFDDRQLKQIAYHLVKAGLHSRNASEETKVELSKLIDFANGFHRVDECGRIEQVKNN